MAIGIIQVRHLQTILVGPHQINRNLSMIHVQQVGVFPMVAGMVFGQRHWAQVRHLLKVLYTIAPTKA